MTDAPVLALQAVRFGWPRSPVDCLEIESLEVAAGDTVFLHGPSGCGKSTLLSLMAGVLLPRQGRVALMGREWAGMRPAARDRHRVDNLGYIFQQFNLLPYLSVLENVLAPCRFSSRRRAAAEHHAGSMLADAQAWLDGMGLERSLWQRPARDLSVGQQQRVAAARALIGRPALVIADEPTSALDEALRESFLDLLLVASAQARSAVVFVSHDQRLAERFRRRLLLPAINRASAPALEPD
ncbi:MAG: ABC transporter ATP-binding protein [Lautropia sp.]